MPEAILHTTGKPEQAGGPVEASTCTWKPVCAGGLIVGRREARQSGRPGDEDTVRYMEAGPCRRPYCVHQGSPSTRVAHYRDLHTHGSRSMLEALLCVEGKPDEAGGPVMNTLEDTWKLAHPGGHVVYNWEARQRGKPTTRIDVHTEAGLRRRPDCRSKGSPTKWEAR